QRSEALDVWNIRYNYHHPHTAAGYRPRGFAPVSPTSWPPTINYAATSPSVPLVATTCGHRCQPRMPIETAITVEGVPHTGDDVVHRVPDITVTGKLIRIE